MEKGVLKISQNSQENANMPESHFYTLIIFHQASRLSKLKIKAGLTPILGELQNELISIRSFGHLNYSLLTIIEKCL